MSYKRQNKLVYRRLSWERDFDTGSPVGNVGNIMAPSKSNGHWTKGMPRKTLLGLGFCLLLESKLLESCCSRKQDMSLILPSHLICEGGYMKREIRGKTKSTDEIEEYQMKEKLKILQINGVAFKLQYKTPWTAKMIIYLKDM